MTTVIPRLPNGYPDFDTLNLDDEEGCWWEAKPPQLPRDTAPNTLAAAENPSSMLPKSTEVSLSPKGCQVIPRNRESGSNEGEEEIRVLTSPDGSNFEEAICFRPTGKVPWRWIGLGNARFRAERCLER